MHSAQIRCPYCLDGVQFPVLCPRCRAPYHEECAGVFGICAVLGCSGLLKPDHGCRALPRLGVLASRSSRWNRDAIVPDVHALIAEPCPRALSERPEIGRAVAEFMGPEYSAFDARVRLQTPFPEPIARFDTAEMAHGACQRLAALGLPVFHAPLQECMASWLPFEPVSVSWAGGLRFRNAQGQVRRHPAGVPRLVMRVTFLRAISVRKTKKIKIRVGRGHSTVGRPTVGADTRWKRELGAFVWLADDPTPTLCRQMRLREEGPDPHSAPLATRNNSSVLRRHRRTWQGRLRESVVDYVAEAERSQVRRGRAKRGVISGCWGRSRQEIRKRDTKSHRRHSGCNRRRGACTLRFRPSCRRRNSIG